MQGMTRGVTAADVTAKSHCSVLAPFHAAAHQRAPLVSSSLCTGSAPGSLQGDRAATLLHCIHGSVLAQHLSTSGKCPGGRWASLAGLCKGTLDKALFLPRKTPCALRERPVSSWGTGQSCSLLPLLQCEHLGSWVMAEGC